MLLGRYQPPPRGALGLTGRAAGSAITGGAAVGLVRRSDKSGVLLDVCLLERGEQGGQHRVLTGARGPLAQLSGQERSSTTMMGAWVPGRPAAAPGSSH